jgi:cell division protein FtsI/penicillin-binding protein 2
MVLILLGMSVVAGRLFYIQIVKGREWAQKCKEQTRLRELVAACRGAIRDRNGYVLASSLPGDRGGGAVSKNSGSQTLASVRRTYPMGSLAGHVIGYIGKDGYGLGGAEYAFDTYLRGEDGWAIMQRDGRNNKYARFDMPAKPPENGADVYLTLDMHIQKIVEKVLRETTRALRAKGGMAMVIDPRTGDILAMANMPEFNPNEPGAYALDLRTNRCISYNYEPGSTFKAITAATALEEWLKNEADTIDANGGVYEIYNQSIRDYRPFGRLSFSEATWYSSNVCFAKLANEIGNRRLYAYAKDFGMGARSGIELPGEEAGIVHPVRDWSGRTRVTMAIGQEVSVTLLQMMMGFGAICNDGVLLNPRICRKIVDNKGRTVHSGEVKNVRRVISSEAAQRLRAMLKGVVDHGTGKRAGIAGASIGGKTGTSQKIDAETGAYSADREWSSFIGFAPVNDPALVCGVVIDEPGNGADGGLAAAPAFRAILTQIISHPQLRYAGALLDSEAPANHAAADSGTQPITAHQAPDLCGMSRDKASEVCAAAELRCDFVGDGARVRYQSPAAGRRMTSQAELVLYTSQEVSAEESRIPAPDCIGKDLRDALNALNVEGLSPYVYGEGVVTEQAPTGGAVVRAGAVCTLYCALDG